MVHNLHMAAIVAVRSPVIIPAGPLGLIKLLLMSNTLGQSNQLEHCHLLC